MKQLNNLKCIDSIDGLDRLGGLDEIYHELLKEFNGSEKPKLKLLKLSLLAKDWNEAIEISHDMKGIAGNLSMPTCFELMSELNDLLLDKSNSYNSDMFDQIEKLYESVFLELDEFYEMC